MMIKWILGIVVVIFILYWIAFRILAYYLERPPNEKRFTRKMKKMRKKHER